MISVDVKHRVHLLTRRHRTQELCESRGGRPGIPFPNKPYGFCGHKATLKQMANHPELRNCVKVEVAVLGSPSLISLMVSMDVKHHV